MRVMSVNLRYDNPEDGKYKWANRFPAMKSIWNQIDADLVGIQEGLPHQVNGLNQAFSVYKYVGKGRDKHGKGEHVGIFFNKNKFTLLEEGHFWLSDTPNIPGSQSYGSAAPRMATWILLKYEEQKLLVLNTHLDHKSEKARKKGSFNYDLNTGRAFYKDPGCLFVIFLAASLSFILYLLLT